MQFIIIPFLAGIVAGLFFKDSKINLTIFYQMSNYITAGLMFFAASQLTSLSFNIFSVLYKSIAIAFILIIVSLALVYGLVRSKNVVL